MVDSKAYFVFGVHEYISGFARTGNSIGKVETRKISILKWGNWTKFSLKERNWAKFSLRWIFS